MKDLVIDRKELRIHPAWLILACSILIQGGIIGLLVNPTGVLFTAVRMDRGFRAGDPSVYYTIRQIVMATTVSFTSRLFFEKNSRWVIGFLGLCGSASFVFMAGFHQLWQWYAAAVMAGIGISCCAVVIPIVLNNWFRSKRGLVVGISMSASGIVGACYSPFCSVVIERLGWRAAAVTTGVLSFAMVCLGCLFLVADPKMAGVEPYGADRTEEKKSSSSSRQKTGGSWMVYWIAVFALIGPNTYTQFNNQLPIFAQEAGYSLGTGAVLTSISMMGNIIGKLGLGILSDKLGIFRAVSMLVVLLGGSQAAFLLGADVLPVMQMGAFLYGSVYAMGTTAPSQVFLALYGEEKYRGKVRKTQMLNSFVLAFAGMLFPYIYDFTGSFTPVFILGIVISMFSLALMLLLEHIYRH